LETGVRQVIHNLLEVKIFRIGLAGLSLGIAIYWPARLRGLLPSPLAALIAGTLAAMFVLPAAPVIGSVQTGLPIFLLPAITLGQLPTIVQPALILSLLGSIDSLLTSLVADSITRTHHHLNRELIGQGIAGLIDSASNISS